MATTHKSIPKAKAWYKNIKEGDKILVQLHPKHAWYDFVGNDIIEVKVQIKHMDGTLYGHFNHPSIKFTHSPCINIGWEGNNWKEYYPATILRKVKKAKE